MGEAILHHSFETEPSVIIPSGGTAREGNVLTGYTFYAGGVLRTGNMINRGSLNVLLSPGQSQAVNPGYYSGGLIQAQAAPSPSSVPISETGSYISRDTNQWSATMFTSASGRTCTRITITSCKLNNKECGVGDQVGNGSLSWTQDHMINYTITISNGIGTVRCKYNSPNVEVHYVLTGTVYYH